MGFYNLSKDEREKILTNMRIDIMADIKNYKTEKISKLMSNSDTYIRKNTYQIIGNYYKEQSTLRSIIYTMLRKLYSTGNEFIRQTTINTFGEIGKFDAESVMDMLELAFKDLSKKVKNAVVGSLKKMGEKNPKPTLEFAKKYLHHDDPKIRQEIIHGIELRGRTHPEDILPLLKEVQNDKNRGVRKKIIHVIAQISYKKDCLEKVISDLNNWENKDLIKEAIEEIIDVHQRYAKFCSKTPTEAQEYINNNLKI